MEIEKYYPYQLQTPERFNSISMNKSINHSLLMNLSLKTDLKEAVDSLFNPIPSLIQIKSFVDEYLGKYPRRKMQISKYNYKKRPYYSLSLFPLVFSVFSNQFKFENKSLKCLLRSPFK